MGLIPDTKNGKILFCEAHVSPWTTNAVAMGSSTSAVTSWSAQVTAARTAYAAQQAAQEASKNATNNLNVALDALMLATASIIDSVRSKVRLSGDSIYSLASLPVPATPTPVGPPGKPFEPKVSLAETGVLTLGWKCNNPPGSSGTIYQVWRQIGETGTLEYLGGSGTKDFIDDTLPAGSTNVMYQIQGVRSTAIGEFATFNVKFGSVSGGTLGVASVEETTTKKAA